MKLIVDTNEIFSFFNEKSKARELSLLPRLELHSPMFSLSEIEKHKLDIIEKFSISETQLNLIKKLLKVALKFHEEAEYSKFLSEALKISPDPDDVDFFALALKLGCPIWSEEKKLKEQTRIKVLNTKDLVDILGF